MTVFKSIKRPSAVEDIIEQFKQALIDGEFKPGERLPSEPELSKRLGVGRSTVREAIKTLVALGAVDVRRGDGTYVSERVVENAFDPMLFAVLVDPKDTTDLYEFRLLFEVGYSRLAAVKADPADFQAMAIAIREMTDYVGQSTHDSTTLANLDLNFHTAVLEATHNSLLIRIGMLLNRMFLEPLKLVHATHEGVQWTLARHQEILTALKNRDADQVEEAVTTSLLGWKRILEKNEVR